MNDLVRSGPDRLPLEARFQYNGGRGSAAGDSDGGANSGMLYLQGSTHKLAFRQTTPALPRLLREKVNLNLP